jgi:hypothetical protein
MIIKEIDVKGIMTKSNLPVADFSINPYVGCSYAKKNHMPYVRDDDSKMSDVGEPPIMANYFYHEEVKKSAKKK